MIVQKLLCDEWANKNDEEEISRNGFDQHVENVSKYYKSRRNALFEAFHKHLPPELASWHVIPNSGMFVWIELHTISDTKVFIEQYAVPDAQILFVPGQEFYPPLSSLTPPTSSASPATSQHIRASYSTANDEEMDIAMERLAQLIRQHER